MSRKTDTLPFIPGIVFCSCSRLGSICLGLLSMFCCQISFSPGRFVSHDRLSILPQQFVRDLSSKSTSLSTNCQLRQNHVTATQYCIFWSACSHKKIASNNWGLQEFFLPISLTQVFGFFMQLQNMKYYTNTNNAAKSRTKTSGEGWFILLSKLLWSYRTSKKDTVVEFTKNEKNDRNRICFG